MRYTSLHVWGDSILKGISYDETRGRYAILRENCVTQLSRQLSVPVENHARMGQTALHAEAALSQGDLCPGGLALVEFGGNDCDMPWAAIAADPAGEHVANTSLSDFAGSLERIVRKLRAGGMQPVLVVPPPLEAGRYFHWISRGLNAENILRWLGDIQRIYRWQELYAGETLSVANRLDCLYIDLRKDFLAHPRCPDLLCVDGIHPSEAGHAVMLRTLSASLLGELLAA